MEVKCWRLIVHAHVDYFNLYHRVPTKYRRLAVIVPSAVCFVIGYAVGSPVQKHLDEKNREVNRDNAHIKQYMRDLKILKYKHTRVHGLDIDPKVFNYDYAPGCHNQNYAALMLAHEECGYNLGSQRYADYETER